MARNGAGHGVGEAPVVDGSISLDPDAVLRALLGVVAALIVMSIAGQAAVTYLPDFALRDTSSRLLSVNAEQSLPTLYSTLLLLLSAVLLAAIGRARTGREHARPWLALALVFSLLAVDEFASLHEDANERAQSLLGVDRGIFLFAWVVPAALIAAAAAIAFVPFLRSLPRATRRRFLSAGFAFVLGAIGMELVGSAYFDANGMVEDMGYALLTAVEEALEMTGVALFVWTLLGYVADTLGGVAWIIRVERRGQDARRAPTGDVTVRGGNDAG